MELIFRQSTARGYPVGASHHRARWPDATVAAARALHAAGKTNRAVAEALGVPVATATGWISGRCRAQQPKRVIVTRRNPEVPK